MSDDFIDDLFKEIVMNCRQLKVYSVEDYRVVQSMSYPAPILSMAMSASVVIDHAYLTHPLTYGAHFSQQTVIWLLA